MSNPSSAPRSGIRAVIRTRAPRGAAADVYRGLAARREIGARGRVLAATRRSLVAPVARVTGLGGLARAPRTLSWDRRVVDPAGKRVWGWSRPRQIGSNDVGEIS